MGRIPVLILVIFIAALVVLPVYACKVAPDIYITNFEAVPNSIVEGETAILRWSVTGSTKISVNNGIGEVSPSGNVQTKPGQTTEYMITADNGRGSIQKSVTVTVAPRPVITAPIQTELPVFSATDTEKLLKNKGKEACVEGYVTYVSSWLPDRFTGQGTTHPWTFIFFMDNVWEGYADNANPGGACSPECWRDYTSYFRAIIKPDFCLIFTPACRLDMP